MDGAGETEAEGETGILEVSVLSVCFFLLGRERQPKKKNNAAIARAIKAPLKPTPEKAVKKKSKPKTNNIIVFFIKNHLSVYLPICPERGGSGMEIYVWQQRTKQNLTLVQLADITGVSKSEINAIENGKASPRLDTLERIAVGLGVNICDLYKSSITNSGK